MDTGTRSVYDGRAMQAANDVSPSDDLARRWAALVADGRGHWLPGMHTARGLCVVLVGLRSDRMGLQDGYGIDDDDVPDWEHHGTTGGLLALVRLAWGPDKRVVIQLLASGGWRPVVYELHGETWVRCDVESFFLDSFADEAEALLAALEAAPKGADNG